MTSIINYLTPRSAPYYERVRMVVDKLISVFEYNVVIYGGMVRDIISHYYEYQVDNMVEFIEPKDVDLHINTEGRPNSCWDYFSMNHYNYLMKKLWDNKMVELDKTDYRTIYQDNYTLVKFVIDGISFDISANVNHWCVYDDITDYSVNCLNVNSNNIIGVRGIDMDVGTILNHIENKMLYNVLDKKKLQRYIDYYNNDVSVVQYYEDKIIERHSKMLDKGYHEI